VIDKDLAPPAPIGLRGALPRKVWPWCAVVLVGAAISLSGTAWTWFGRGDQPQVGAKPPPATKRLSIVPVALTSQLDVLGSVNVGHGVVIVAPFDGVIGEKMASLGESAAAGDVLLKMDDGEIQARLREAQSALLKAAMAENDIRHWEVGPDVTRARRALEASQRNKGPSRSRNRIQRRIYLAGSTAG
jgi:multidrug efflux pump subunit AcrA (membrane-fusion protein)